MTTVAPTAGRAFQISGVRSKSVVVGFGLAILVESIALHLMLYRRWPIGSLVLLALNVWTIWWLVRDYRALQRLPLVVRDGDVLVRMGRRFSGSVPFASIEDVFRPTWQQVPEVGAAGYLRLGSDPNVMLRLGGPVTFTGPFGIRKQATLIGLQLDEADEFIRTVREGRKRQ